MNKELTPLETYKEFLDIVDVPVKNHLLNSIDKPTLERYRVLRTQIEVALKNYEELAKKPVILYVRTHGSSQALIDKICKVHKEIKITNIVDEDKAKAFDIFKENLVFGYDESENDKQCLTLGIKVDKDKLVVIYQTFDKEKIDLLKEVLK